MTAHPGATAGDAAVAAARAYIEALASHDVSDVPLAPGCRRVENCIPTGRSGAGIARDLQRSRKYRVIRRVEIESIRMDSGVVRAVFDVHVVAGLVARVRECFDVDDAGRIVRITARIGMPRRR